MWFAEHTNKLPVERRLHFYERLAHNLTVAVRYTWSNEGITDTEKVERMKWINELMHAVTAKVYSLRLSPGVWTEEDFSELVEGYFEPDKRIAPEVERAIRTSYQTITGEDMAPRPGSPGT